jgi:hypothetical protein
VLEAPPDAIYVAIQPALDDKKLIRRWLKHLEILQKHAS